MISFFKQCQLLQNLNNGHQAFVNSAFDIYIYIYIYILTYLYTLYIYKVGTN